jgi:hypothetical protein
MITAPEHGGGGQGSDIFVTLGVLKFLPEIFYLNPSCSALCDLRKTSRGCPQVCMKKFGFVCQAAVHLQRGLLLCVPKGSGVAPIHVLFQKTGFCFCSGSA